MITKSAFARSKQCSGCPWKKSTDPHTDIPRYDPEKHCKLTSCTSTGLLETKVMACHESTPEKEYACVGWMKHQLGEGNNIPLRILALDHKIKRPVTVGPQHESLEAMCATAKPQRKPEGEDRHPEHSQVALTRDLPQHGLKAGALGTIVHVYATGTAYEVEFTQAGQETYVATLPEHELRLAPESPKYDPMAVDECVYPPRSRR